MNTRVLLALGAGICFLGAPLRSHAGGPFGDVWKGWEFVKEADGIKVYKRQVQGSDLLDFGGEGTLDFPVDQLCAVLEDIPGQKQWVDSLEMSQYLEQKSPRDYFYFQQYDLPWPISDRDFVVRHTWKIDRENKVVTINDISVNHPKRPVNDCCIRGSIELAEIRMAPIGEKKTTMIALARADMKGLLPAWMINSIQEDFPLNTFVGYKKQASKPYKIPPQCKNIFADEATATATATTAKQATP